VEAEGERAVLLWQSGARRQVAEQAAALVALALADEGNRVELRFGK
jgi:hypothetical protein